MQPVESTVNWLRIFIGETFSLRSHTLTHPIPFIKICFDESGFAFGLVQATTVLLS